MSKMKISEPKGNILLVDGDLETREAAALALRLSGFQVFEADNGIQAFLLAETLSETLHLLITDAFLDGSPNGLELARSLKSINRRMKALYYSSERQLLGIENKLPLELPLFLSKPLDLDKLIQKSQSLIERIRQEAGMGTGALKREKSLAREVTLKRLFPEGFHGRIFTPGTTKTGVNPFSAVRQ